MKFTLKGLTLASLVFAVTYASADLRVTAAWYGIEGNEISQDGEPVNGKPTNLDVTKKVQAALAKNKGQFITIPDDMNAFFGKDPLFGTVKTLAVQVVEDGVVKDLRSPEWQDFIYPYNAPGAREALRMIKERVPSNFDDMGLPSDTVVAIKAPNGKYLAVQADNTIDANGSSAQNENCQFKVLRFKQFIGFMNQGINMQAVNPGTASVNALGIMDGRNPDLIGVVRISNANFYADWAKSEQFILDGTSLGAVRIFHPTNNSYMSVTNDDSIKTIPGDQNGSSFSIEIIGQQSGGVAITAGTGFAWAIARDGSCFFRSGITASNPAGTQWTPMDGENFANITVAHTGRPWAIGKDGSVWWREGFSATNLQGTSWKRHPYAALTSISAGRNGMIWGTNAAGDVWTSEGTDITSAWLQVANPQNSSGGRINLMQIRSGVNGQVWALDADGKLYFREGISTSNLLGTAWSGPFQDTKDMQSISVGFNGQLLAIAEDQTLWFREGITKANPKGTGWSQITDYARGLQISCSPTGEHSHVNISGHFWFRTGSNASNVFGAGWINLNAPEFLVTAELGGTSITPAQDPGDVSPEHKVEKPEIPTTDTGTPLDTPIDRTVIDELIKQINDQRNKTEALQAQLKSAQDTFAKTDSARTDINKQLGDKRGGNDALQSEVTAAQQTLAKTQSDLTEVNNNVMQVNTNLDNLIAVAEKLGASLTDGLTSLGVAVQGLTHNSLKLLQFDHKSDIVAVKPVDLTPIILPTSLPTAPSREAKTKAPKKQVGSKVSRVGTRKPSKQVTATGPAATKATVKTRKQAAPIQRRPTGKASSADKKTVSSDSNITSTPTATVKAQPSRRSAGRSNVKQPTRTQRK